jgi:hypothetical protein
MTCHCAARAGQLEALKWAREHGCPWEESRMCHRAALGGHLGVLKWLRELGRGLHSSASQLNLSRF